MVVLERGQFLDELGAILGEASRRRGRLVLVRGEAGIGKTTLVEAFTSGRGRRVFWGMCDPLVPPRPLAPVLDIADQVGGELRLALSDPDPHRMLTAFLGLLRAEGGPWIVVLEDVQWADDATLELLRLIGRRATQLSAVLIATVRDDEIGPDHPLSVALGDIPAASVVSLVLPPLSLAAVAELAAGTAIDPIALYGATTGNPFLVHEVIASGGAELPTTVRDAVSARTRRLSPAGLHVARAAAVLGPRCDAEILCSVAAVPFSAVDETVARGILRGDRSTIEFHHELSRMAVLESLPPSERSRLHQRALLTLRRSAAFVSVDELARHAVGAMDVDSVLELAPKAGAQAAALGAHRAAEAHYESALRYASRLPDIERASLLAAHAHESFLTGDTAGAVASQQASLACWQRTGDVGAQGGALSDLAEYLWWQGEAEEAHRVGGEAVELLKSGSADANGARVYARLAQISMMSGHFGLADEWASQAVAVGDQFGDEAVVVHALNTLGVAHVRLGAVDGWAHIEESLRRAAAANLEEHTARAYNNLLATARRNRWYDRFDRYSQQAAAFFDQHDLDASELCLIGDVVDALVERGRWSEAASQAQAVVERGSRHGRVECLAVLGRLAARRGEAGAREWLDEALELQERYGGELTYPLRAARAEAAWLAGDLRLAASEIEAGLPAFDERSNAWQIGELAFWARKVGVPWDVPSRPAEPYAYYLDGYPDKAASAWAALGCPYEEALSLADTEDETQVRRSLAIFQSLEASPAVRLVTERLHAMGVRRIERGPRAATRANPAGLSDREVEVLALLTEGLRNAEIAARLVVSTRTVDHHVSAILRKLDARSRHDASRKASRLGLA